MNNTTDFLKLNLIEKYQKDTELLASWNKYKSKIQGFKKSHEGYKIGDTIEFIAGYNDDILYTTIILGFDYEGDIFVLWDCYWSPIRLTDKRRQIKKV